VFFSPELRRCCMLEIRRMWEDVEVRTRVRECALGRVPGIVEQAMASWIGEV
jgi:hypothetical protein